MSALCVRNLSVRGPAGPILRGIDLDVGAGELVLLAGASGGGKTTLLRALGGLLPPSGPLHVEGTVTLGGIDVLGAPARDLAGVAGQVFQHAEEQLLSFDVEGEVLFKLENLDVPPREAARRAAASLDRFGIARLRRLESARLSGGEARRVALAAAFANEPPVLLLDEPFTGLDGPSRARLLADLRALRGRATVVVAEHHASALVPLADRAITLEDGVLVEGIAPEPAIPRAPPAKPRGRGLTLEGVEASPSRGAPPALRGVDLSIGLGEVVGLTGPNGAGKTTLLRVAAGLRRPDAGRVRWLDGRDRAPPAGYVPQRAGELFTHATVREELGPRGAPLAKRHGLEALLARHPLSLSGGERGRLALACALAGDPPLLLLDEPTVGLDATSRLRLVETLHRAAARGALVLAATHDEDLLAACHRVLALRDGRIRDADASPVAAATGRGAA